MEELSKAIEKWLNDHPRALMIAIGAFAILLSPLWLPLDPILTFAAIFGGLQMIGVRMFAILIAKLSVPTHIKVRVFSSGMMLGMLIVAMSSFGYVMITGPSFKVPLITLASIFLFVFEQKQSELGNNYLS